MQSNNNSRLTTIFLIVFIDLLGFGLILPLLPYIAENYNANPLVIGLLSASYSLFQFLAGPILGRLSDRYGRKKILIISQIGSVIGYLLLATANSLPLLFLSRIIDGITGGNISIAQAYMADITDKKTRAKGMGLLGAAFGLGFMLGPATGGYLSRFGFAIPALVAAIIGTITTLMTVFFLKETVNLKVSTRSPNTKLTWDKFRLLLSKQPIGLLIVVSFLISLGFAGMQGTYAIWAQDSFNWGPSQVGSIFAYIGILSIIAQTQLLPRLISYFGEKKLLIISLPTLALGFLLLSLTRSLPLHLFANFFIVLGNSLANPTLNALATENIEPSEYGETLGVLQSASSLGRIIGPALAGELYFVIGKNSPFQLSALILILTSIYLSRRLGALRNN
ncbi:MFS transporter [Candidatus Woesebacteria bacterium]|nr:MFS transporter [Candidatus Woesebacteria bacterium]